MSVHDMPAPKAAVELSHIEYAGYVIRKTGDGWVALKNGASVIPGAARCDTAEEAQYCVDVLEAVGGDAQKFWHLNYAILRACGRLK